ncbi:MAG: hypothetical protein ACK5MT_02830 [Actinomycetales bacterium]
MPEPTPLHGRGRRPRAVGLWRVCLTVAGEVRSLDEVAEAMARLDHQSPFLAAIRYDTRHARITYWDEADVLEDAAAMALRLWLDHRDSAGLPDWKPIGLEVLDRQTYVARGAPEPTVAVTGDIRPF